MTDLLNPAIIQEVAELLVLAIGAGLALSCIASALSWSVLSVIKLMHKLF